MSRTLGATATLVALASAVLAVGCASAPKPTSDLASAHTLIQEADQSGANQYASADLEAARLKIQKADQQAADKPVIAQRLAQESALDAQVALARTRAVKEQQALQQVESGTSTLQNETDRGAPINTPAPAPVAPSPPPAG